MSEPARTNARAVERARHLGDFTLSARVLQICALALPVGALAALAAWCLLRLIGLFTNLFFYGRWEAKLELLGVVTRRDLLGASHSNGDGSSEETIGDVMSEHLATAYPDETLRDVAYRIAEHGVTRMPVIARDAARQIVGIVTLPAMLAGRLRDLQEERDSERILQIARPPMGPGSAFRPGNGVG